MSDEIIIPLSNGCQLVCGPGEHYQFGGSVTIRGADGKEILHWVSDEWRDDPEHVMGAIFGAAVSKNPAVGSVTPVENPLTLKQLLRKLTRLKKLPQPIKWQDSHYFDRCCPECGSRYINVEISTVASIHSDGLTVEGDMEFTGTSVAYCRTCAFSAPMRFFEFEGLENALTQRE